MKIDNIFQTNSILAFIMQGKYVTCQRITHSKSKNHKQKYQITLPEEDVYFLIQIGNGGARSYYRI